MAKKSKPNWEGPIFRCDGAIVTTETTNLIRSAAEKTSSQAGGSAYARAMQDVDPVILLMRQCFGRYQLEMKLTKKRKKPLSRD